MINELFQDALDEHGTESDGYLAPLSGRTRQLMREWWAITDGYEKTLSKYQMILVFADEPKLDQGREPYQSAADLIALRDVLVHSRSESVSADQEHRLAKRLRHKIGQDNRLIEGSGNPWWPDFALGAGCASWAYEAALAFADTVTNRVGITPNYQRIKDKSGWWNMSQGASE